MIKYIALFLLLAGCGSAVSPRDQLNIEYGTEARYVRIFAGDPDVVMLNGDGMFYYYGCSGWPSDCYHFKLQRWTDDEMRVVSFGPGLGGALKESTNIWLTVIASLGLLGLIIWLWFRLDNVRVELRSSLALSDLSANRSISRLAEAVERLRPDEDKADTKVKAKK